MVCSACYVYVISRALSVTIPPIMHLLISLVLVLICFMHQFTACIHLYVVPKKISGVTLSLTTVTGEAAINVTWDAPVDDVAIDHYEVMYLVMEHTAAGGTNTSTDETLLLTGLVKGAVYQVQVRAVSVEGRHAGEYSAVQSTTVPGGEQ